MKVISIPFGGHSYIHKPTGELYKVDSTTLKNRGSLCTPKHTDQVFTVRFIFFIMSNSRDPDRIRQWVSHATFLRIR